MKIINETQLMANQKASEIIVPDNQFEALQTLEGNSLLFSIGTDNILYCTRELPGDAHGWNRIDLSTALSASYYNGAAVTAKTFDIAQDLSSVNTIDMALVVTVNGQDHLHLATGFTNTLDNWTNALPTFVPYPFDDFAHTSYGAAPINEVQIVDGNGNQYIIADLITNETTQTISRYYIDTSKSLYQNPTTQAYCAWVPHNLSVDLQSGKITSFLGSGPADGPNGNNIGGVYVLGTVNNEAQLLYAPSFNFFNPEMQQDPTVFTIPAGTDATHMAMALSAPGAVAPYTDLFFASNGSLYFLANADQVDTATSKPAPASIYAHGLFQNIQSMHIENWNDTIVLWGQSLSTDGSGTSQVFIMEGIAGQETNPDAWSCPIPLLFDVVNSATYINNQLGNNVIFTQQVVNEVSSLAQLFQDPVTTAWQQRSLLTAPSAENLQTAIYDTTTYSSHIEITDDNNIAQPNIPALLWASSPCSVYISDANNQAAYYTLDTVKPLALTSDFSGNITIMQPVDTIGGICYYMSVQDPSTGQYYNEAINPLTGSITALNSKVPDGNGNYLNNVNVTNEQGVSTPLVGSGMTAAQTQSASSNIYTTCQNSSSLNQDGLATGQTWPTPGVNLSATRSVSAARLQPERLAKDLRFNPTTDKIWGCTFGQHAQFYDGFDAMKGIGVALNPDNSLSLSLGNGELGSVLGAIEAKAGHLYKWMQSEGSKLEKLVITLGEDGLDCLLTIEGAIYHFVIKCLNDIANLVNTVLNAVETAFEDVVKWIGMIFSFGDILRTHEVFSNIINVFLDFSIDSLPQLSTVITNVFDSIEQNVDAKTGLPVQGLPPSTQTYSGAMSTSTPPSGSKSPSANYGTNQFKDNSKNSDNNYNSAYTPVSTLFDSLLTMIENEGEAIETAATQIQGIAKTGSTTPVTTLLTEIMGVIVDLLLNTAENMLQEEVTVLNAMISQSKDVLNSTIHIPVLTYLYRKITVSDEFPNGKDLTPLDLFCLVTAIPVTVIYKIVKEQAPFPEGAATDALINATDITSLQQAMAGLQAPASSVPAGLLGHGDDDTGMTPLNIAGSLASTWGAIVVDVALFAKTQIPYPDPEASPVNVVLNKIFSVFQCVGFMGYVLPDAISAVQTYSEGFDDDNEWYVLNNNLCTGLAVVKAVVDASSNWWPSKTGDPYGQKISPALDYFLNVAWQVPTVFQLVHDMKEHDKFVPADINAIVECIGGTFFDFSGMLSVGLASSYFLMKPSTGKESAVLSYAAVISASNLIWGGSNLATTFDGLPTPS